STPWRVEDLAASSASTVSAATFPLPRGRAHVKLCPLRRRSRGERAPVKLRALRPRRGREREAAIPNVPHAALVCTVCIIERGDRAMRIAVMGAGGVGGYFGALLARAGHEVTFVARGAHLAAIQQHGLRVESTLDGTFTVPGRAVGDTTQAGP